MKSYYSCLVSLVMCLFLQSCAFAPFGNTYSAHTVGKNEIDLQLGTVVDASMVPVGRLGYGLFESTDIGVLTEFQYTDALVGLYVKHAIYQQDKGVSFAMEGSAGSGSGEQWYAYIGPILSYKMGWFEPYAIARFNYVRQNLQYIDWFWGDEVNSGVVIKYGLFTAGATLWANNHLGLTMSANLAAGDYQFAYGAVGLVLKT